MGAEDEYGGFMDNDETDFDAIDGDAGHQRAKQMAKDRISLIKSILGGHKNG